MTNIEKIWGGLEDGVLGLLSSLALALVCFEVVARYFYPALLPDWGAEVTIYLVVTSLLIAGSPLVMDARHIRADLFLRMLSRRLQRSLELLNLVIGFLYCALIAGLGVDVVAFAHMLDERSESSIQFPLYIFYMALPAGFALMTVRYAIRLYRFLFAFTPGMLPDGEGDMERIEKSRT